MGGRLRSPFRPSASYFDEAKVTKTFRSGFRPDFVGFLRPVTDPGVAWRPARLPPDQRQDSAVTNVALCVVSATVGEKHFCGSGCGLDYRSHAPRGNAFRDALRRKRTQSVRNGVPTQSIGTIVIVRNSERL
ncbi:hypothetical protein SAMN05444507_11094 [Pseudomonas syringae]|nr:hypothetical protein SAMN05444507_11094 [Pseudomonas syringae]